MHFSIREATREDVPALLKLIKDLAVYERLLDQVVASEDLLARAGFGEERYFRALLAEDSDGRAIGFALYFFTFSTFLARPTLYLEDLFVLPELRGRGVGKALLRELAKIALEKGCGRMEWAVLNWNRPAIDFYRSLGALPQEEWTTFRLTGEALERLSKAD